MILRIHIDFVMDFANKGNCIDGVMVSVLASSAVYGGIESNQRL